MAADGGGYGWQPRAPAAAPRNEGLRKGREYRGERGREPAEPGWVGGGRFPAWATGPRATAWERQKKGGTPNRQLRRRSHPDGALVRLF
jgi:hypothetical protein